MIDIEKHIIKEIGLGNVTQVASSYSWMQGQNLTETFTYDASDQLVSASETQFQSYLLDVTYGNWGKISDYDLTRTDYYTATVTQDSRSFTYPGNPGSPQASQTMFAPETHTGTTDAQYTFGINGSLRKVETYSDNPVTEHYLFNSAANLKAYGSDAADFAYYGYNASNARAYKMSLSGTYQWHNGQQLQLSLQPQLSMFYPNAYINFNGNGEYTKHYYSGSERIASRLGNANTDITVTANARLANRSSQLDNRFQEDILDLMPEGVSVSSSGGVNVSSLESPTGTASDIYYYHTNHLGSTAFVTDQNQNVTQGFLYAPFGEITTEFDANFGSDIIPKYSFNAKELDEETGMYYYEARYYKPPVFTSRDAMFEKKPWLTPYHYCSNNPVGRVDFNGMDDYEVNRKTGEIKLLKTTDDNYDRLVAQNEKGIVKYKKNGDYKKRFVLKVDKEFMESQQTGKQEFGVEAKIYRLKGENREREATNIFRFLSFHTEVEWGLAGSKDENTICKGSDKYEWEGYRAALRYGENLEYYYHSHPGNNASPFPSKEKGRDLDCWNTLWEKNPNALMGILMWHSTIQLYRKTNNNKGYAPTNKN